MSDRGKKRRVISVSDNSDSESEPEQEEYEDEDDEAAAAEEEDSNSSPAASDDDDDDSEWSSEEEEETDQDSIEDQDQEDGDSAQKSVPVPLDEGAQYKKVIQLLKGGGDLQSLKLEECKAYLRKLELRMSGTKAVCIQRIQEHWRIKDDAEKLYPRSSFSINCTGDVCKGDVVLFKQRVYDKFNKVRRGGNVLGKRTIVGRVVKESYGAAKQQHTFTVEVLWSKGIKKLPPLFPLLVKGRNLYRMRTFRQCWDNEAERSRVLAEKHKRGAAARHIRAMKKAGTANGAAKRQKVSHDMRPPKRSRNQESQPATRKHAANCKTKRASKAERKRVSKPRATEPSFRNLETANSMEFGVTNPYAASGPQNHYMGHGQHHSGEVSHMNYPNRGGAFGFSNHHIGSTSAETRMATPRHYPMMNSQPHYGYTAPGYQFEPSPRPRRHR